ncbi:MAG: hypothetical protein KBS59_04190 [Clostridiales bacterium]|nr:hypothetical protein [Clostridiales bacterium]
MKKETKIAFIGGDARSLCAASYMREKGCHVQTLGYGDDDSPAKILSHTDAAIFPVNQSTDVIKTVDGRAFSLDAILKSANEKIIYFGGEKCEKILHSFLPEATYYDITKCENFAIINADITSEGAIGIMINELPMALSDMSVAVIGAGRIGTSLSEKLVPLCKSVKVFARNAATRENIKKYCEVREIPSFCGKDFDCVVNTVPCRVLSDEQVHKIKKDAHVIELASSPYGFDESEISQICRYIFAPGLPGKVAPQTSGKIMAQAVLDILKGEKLK